MVAVLGLGSLGSAVAARLVDAGHPVVVWNRTPKRIAGARIAATAREAASGAEVVLACVRDESASRDTWLGVHEAVAGLSDGAIAVEISSLPPAWLAELEPHVRARGARLVDAPVAGGPAQVRAAAAHLMVGGDVPDRVHPILDALGTWQHAGPLGSASVLKALRNALVAVELGAMAEVLAVAAAHDLGAAALLEVLDRGGGPASPVLRRALAASLEPPRPATFTTALSLKDTRIALDLADAAAVRVPMMAAAAELLRTAVDGGRGAAAHTCVIDLRR